MDTSGRLSMTCLPLVVEAPVVAAVAVVAAAAAAAVVVV